MSNGYAISKWQDAKTIYKQLGNLTSKPIYSISDDELKRVLDYFETKCAKSKEITTEAKSFIPGGVQHNLAFNYPFPICVVKADGAIAGGEWSALRRARLLEEGVPFTKDGRVDMEKCAWP